MGGPICMDLRSKLRKRVPGVSPLSGVCAIFVLTEGTLSDNSVRLVIDANTRILRSAGQRTYVCFRRWDQSAARGEHPAGHTVPKASRVCSGRRHMWLAHCTRSAQDLALPVPRPCDQSEGRPELPRRSTDWHRQEHLEALDLRALIVALLLRFALHIGS